MYEKAKNRLLGRQSDNTFYLRIASLYNQQLVSQYLIYFLAGAFVHTWIY